MVATRRLGTVLLAGLALAPAHLFGQTAAQSTRYPDLDRAHDESMQVLEAGRTKAALQEAARRHARVVELRPSDDARRFECLMAQASLLIEAGDLTAARTFLSQAAQTAQDDGDVFNAAMAHIDGALVADRAGDTEMVDILKSRAYALTYSRYLTPRQRGEIMVRLQDEVEYAVDH